MKKFDETKSKLAQCETEELLTLWNERGDKALREDAVMAIIDLLHERGADIPDDLLSYEPPEQKKRYLWLIVAYAVGKVFSEQFPESSTLDIISTAVLGAIIGGVIGLAPVFLFKAIRGSTIKKISPFLCAIAGAFFGILGAGLMLCVLVLILLTKNPQNHR